MAKYSDRVFGQNVSPEIIEIFEKLQDGYLPNPLDQVGDNQGTMAEGGTRIGEKDYLGEEAMFARMWVAVLVEEEVEKGEGDKTETETTQRVVYYVINDNRDKSASSYEANESVDSSIFTELTDNPLLKPRAGITSISSKTEGALGAILRTDIEFQVHNKKDFDQIFLPFFLKPGATVILDYGRSSKNAELYNIEDSVYNDDFDLGQLKDDLYGTKDLLGNQLKQGFVNRNFGKVNVIVGRVLDYNVSVNEQGSFNCTITITSENTTVLDKEITYDNNLKYVFKNQIEDILIGVLGSGNKSSLLDYNSFSAEERKQVRNQLYENLNVASTLDGDKTIEGSLIPPQSVKTGLFYQDILNTEKKFSVKNEVLYICVGLFEDLFLNGIIAGHLSDKRHAVGFNFKDSFVRFDDNLRKRQKAILGTNERLPLFLYPNDWRDSYNNEIRGGKLSNEEYRKQKMVLNEGTQYENEYKTKIIPLRELFVSVELISSMFSKKQSVNDALDGILEKINKDSYDVFKLKMKSLNQSNSAVTIQDANLLPVVEEEEKNLVFDVTSQRSIVKSMDYKLEMPKGGLESVIAIGNSGTEYNFFDDPAKDNLNFLRLLQDYDEGNARIVDYKSLPYQPKKEEESDAEKKKKEKEDQKLKVFEFGEKLSKKFSIPVDANVSNMKTSFQDAVSTIKDAALQKEKVDVQNYGKEEDTDSDARDTVSSNSFRDYYGKLAQQTVLLSSEKTSVSPIMPLSLSLTVFGNSYLNIGDIININFLPRAYVNRVYFQIVGINHKIDNDWSTTYETKMRIKPTSKKRVVRTIPKPVLDKKFTRSMVDKDGQLGLGTVSVLEGEPIVFDERINISVSGVKTPNLINEQTYRKALGLKKTFVGEKFNFRRIEFGKSPKSIEDIAFLKSFMLIMGHLIQKGALKNKESNKFYQQNFVCTLDPEYGDTSGIYSSFDFRDDFFAFAYFQDENYATEEQSTLNDYLSEYMESAVPNTKGRSASQMKLERRKFTQQLTSKIFGKDDNPIINKSFTNPIFNIVEDKPNPSYIRGRVAGKKPKMIDLNKKYGVIIRAYLLKIGESSEDVNRDANLAFLPLSSDGIYYTYDFTIDLGTSKGFAPVIKIPKYLFDNSGVSVNDWIYLFQYKYAQTLQKLRDLENTFNNFGKKPR